MDDCAASPPQTPVGNKSGRTVKCVKFGKELPGLDSPPWPGELGQRVFESVSVQAWNGLSCQAGKPDLRGNSQASR